MFKRWRVHTGNMRRWEIALVFLLFLSGTALAQNAPGCDTNWDPGCQVAQLANWNSSDTIPVGTIITTQNWEKYKRFIDVGWQSIFSGRYPIKMPADAQMVVGPTIPIPVPKLYDENTEKYSGQVTLRQLSTDGYVPVNYTAGLPFPKLDVNDPTAGIKALYDYYYHWAPAIEYGGHSELRVRDRFGNTTATGLFFTFYHMSHLSDPNYPMNPDFGKGWYKTEYLQLTYPEQAKYTATLTAFHEDPASVEEHYAFLPSLRRSLRLSGAARCSPVAGTDFVQDDLETGFGGQPSGFAVKYLGEKKILALVHLNRRLFDSKDVAYEHEVAPNFFPVQWTKPEAGKWELRDVIVMSIQRLPKDGGDSYCYGPRVLYVDKETGAGIGSELYDKSGKLWKSEQVRYAITPVPGTPNFHIGGPSNAIDAMYDFQNNHISATFNKDGFRDGDIPAEFRNVERYGYPSGLDQVMK